MLRVIKVWIAIISVSVLCVFTALLVSRLYWHGSNLSEVTTKRATYATSGDKPFKIIFIRRKSSQDHDQFLDGAQLALEELNSQGGLLGRSVEGINLVEPDDSTSIADVLRPYLADSSVIASVNDLSPKNAKIAASIYDNYKVLFVATSTTSTGLTALHLDLVFRIVPDNDQIMRSLVEFAQRKSWKRIAILHGRNFYSEEVATLFAKHASQSGTIITPIRLSLSGGTGKLRELIASMRPLDLDAVFFGGGAKEAAHLVEQLNLMDLHVPVIFAQDLDSDILTMASRFNASDGSVVPAVWNTKNPLAEKFCKTFEDRFGYAPNVDAALAYDAVGMIKHGAEVGKSADPVIMASTLKYMISWEGVSGKTQFSNRGGILSKKIYFKVLEHGKPELVSD